MLIVGERINASRKAIAAAISAQDAAAIIKEAKDQKNAGAHFIDVNAGIFVDEEVRYLKWMVQTIQQEAEIPLCIDSPNPKAITEALALHKGRAMINSITDEKERYQSLIPIIKQFKPLVVALCMTDGGMPHTSDERFKIASRLIDKLTKEGVAPQDIYIDPLVMPISTDKSFGNAVLETIEKITTSFPKVNTICGLSNISYGLPSRKLINQLFLVAAMTKGLSGVIFDPLDKRIMGNLITTRALLGKDDYCGGYLTAFRAGKLDFKD
jgi:5-methyltetrahydrofolate corrinoid/iron sulfur protein methyltransferase